MDNHIIGKFKKLLSSNLFIAIVLGCVFFLTAPALHLGLVADDYYMQLILKKDKVAAPLSHSPFNLCYFSDGSKAENVRMKNNGLIEWWVPENYRLFRLRPLSNATHWVDYQLWPQSPFLMHLHSIAWYLCAVFALALAFRKITGSPAIAGLAVLIFACDNFNGANVAWIAARNITIALFFSALSLLFYAKYAVRTNKKNIFLSIVFLLAALLSHEIGLAIVVYIFLHIMLVYEIPVKSKLKLIALYASCLSIWLLVYLYLNCGTLGTFWYFNYIHDFRPLVKATLFNFPYYAQLMILKFNIFNKAKSQITFIGLMTLCIFIVVFFKQIYKNKMLQVFGIGTLLCLILITTSYPDERHLLFANAGKAVFLAVLSGLVIEKAIYSPQKLFYISKTILIAALLFIHIVVSAYAFTDSKKLILLFKWASGLAEQSIPDNIPGQQQHIFMLNNQNHYLTVAIPGYMKALKNKFTPLTSLTATLKPIKIITTSANQIEIYSLKYSLTDRDFLPNRSAIAMYKGKIIALPEVTIEVLEVKHGLPSAARFTFNKPVADKRYIWLQWSGKYVPAQLPAIGKTSIMSR